MCAERERERVSLEKETFVKKGVGGELVIKLLDWRDEKRGFWERGEGSRRDFI